MNWLILNICKKHNTKQPTITKQSINGDTLIEITSNDRIEILLKEYELCTSDANHLEDSIWTATSILILATSAGVGFLGISLPRNIYDLIAHFMVSIYSLLIVHYWYKIVAQWHDIQSVIYERSETIEKELCMCKNLKIRDRLMDIKKDKRKGYSVTKSLKSIRRMLRFIWGVILIVQVAWYFFLVTGLSNTIWWLSIK